MNMSNINCVWPQGDMDFQSNLSTTHIYSTIPRGKKITFFIFSSFLYHNKRLLIFHPATFIDRRTIDVFKSCYATYWFQYCFHNNRSWRVGTIIILPVDHRDKFHFHGYQVRLSYEIIFSSRIDIKTINVISMKNF